MTIVAYFGSIGAMKPDLIRRLRDGIGLTALIPDNYTVHHSGFRMPQELLDASPIARWQESKGLDQHRRAVGLASDASPVFPGIVGPRYDDTEFLTLIDTADKLGVEVWAHLGLWGYGGDIFPNLALVDDRGALTPEEHLPWGVPICPNNPEVRDWTADCMAYIARSYSVKAMDVDHGHFPPPASVTSLLGCCCPHCQAQATAWGYDWDALMGALRSLRTRLDALTAAQVTRAAQQGASLFDFLGFLGYDRELMAWFRFRTQSVTEHMRALTAAVHAAVGDACPVDSHLFPPSTAYLSGQDFPAWEGAVDRLTPGWGPVVGWDQCQTNSFAIWARKLATRVPGLDEEAALAVIYRLFGYDHLAMPSSAAALEAGAFSIAECLMLEISKAASLFSGRKPFLPPFQTGRLTPDEVSGLGQVIKASGAKGFVTGGNPSDEVLRAMRSGL